MPLNKIDLYSEFLKVETFLVSFFCGEKKERAVKNSDLITEFINTTPKP